MPNVVLDSLEIRRFRAFDHLIISQLGRVNLITARNNVGKTCLLEALHLYARRGASSLIGQLLESRDEIGRATRNEPERSEQVMAVRYLFRGRPDIREPVDPIEIGPLDSPTNRLSVAVGWYITETSEGGQRNMLLLQPGEYRTAENPFLGIRIQMGTRDLLFRRFDPYLARQLSRLSEVEGIASVFVPANGQPSSELAQLWDMIALTSLENDVLTSLHVIAPNIERVSLVGDSTEYGERRIPIVKIAGVDSPLPLRSLGEGMNRMFGIALALVNAKDGLMLVDEIESGLHYSVQPEMWRLVFDVAERLNVQVFATTHSWDCIAAFQQVAQERHTEGLLVRLSERKGVVISTLFSEGELAIATREQIEVR